MKIVKLANGTVGTLDFFHPEDSIGQVVKIKLHDENGNPIEAIGILEEVF